MHRNPEGDGQLSEMTPTPQEQLPRHRTEVAVGFADLDVMGHLNNVALLRYLEGARVNYLVDLGLSEVAELGPVLASLQVQFHAQAYFRDRLTCGTATTSIGTSSFVLRQVLWRESPEDVVADATSALVVLTDDQTKPKPVPASWRRAIRMYEGPVIGLGPASAGRR